MKMLSIEDKWMIEKECENCVKFRGDHCLALSEFWCLARTGRGCPAKVTSLFVWKKTLTDMARYNMTKKCVPGTQWVVEELKKVDRKMDSEIDQCRYENEHKLIKRGKSESGRDKSYKRKRGGTYHPKGKFPDLER
jgi:hypothetical protein